MAKSVLISIKPKWCELIASGKKTVEVRKTKPKIDVPFKCYIYCTNSKTIGDFILCKSKENAELFGYNMAKGINKGFAKNEDINLKGKVIGEFVCDKIYEMVFTPYNHGEHIFDDDLTYKMMYLSPLELDDYLRDEHGYGWHISNLKIYDKPKELSEFFVYCDRCDKRPIACKFAYEESNENGYYSECMCDFKRPIEKTPQSWCYVEEL